MDEVQVLSRGVTPLRAHERIAAAQRRGRDLGAGWDADRGDGRRLRHGEARRGRLLSSRASPDLRGDSAAPRSGPRARRAGRQGGAPAAWRSRSRGRIGVPGPDRRHRADGRQHRVPREDRARQLREAAPHRGRDAGGRRDLRVDRGLGRAPEPGGGGDLPAGGAPPQEVVHADQPAPAGSRAAAGGPELVLRADHGRAVRLQGPGRLDGRIPAERPDHPRGPAFAREDEPRAQHRRPPGHPEGLARRHLQPRDVDGAAGPAADQQRVAGVAPLAENGTREHRGVAAGLRRLRAAASGRRSTSTTAES